MIRHSLSEYEQQGKIMIFMQTVAKAACLFISAQNVTLQCFSLILVFHVVIGLKPVIITFIILYRRSI